MRIFSLLFAFISLVLLAQLVVYLLMGPVNLWIAGFLFLGFLGCLAPALYLLKPFERPSEEQQENTKDTRGDRGA